jgi:hypothetical protein
MVSKLPGLKENPKKQFDVIGKYLKDNFQNLKGYQFVHDKTLEKQSKVSTAGVQIGKNAHGYYFEVSINLKDYHKGYNKFGYQLYFDNKGVCTNTILPSKGANASSPYPLNYLRMMMLLKRNQKALLAKINKKNKLRVAEK